MLSLNLQTFFLIRVFMLQAERVFQFSPLSRLMSECCAIVHKRSERNLHYENTTTSYNQSQLNATLFNVKLCCKTSYV